MTKEKNKVKEIKLSNLTSLDSIDLSGGYSCDVETGICGPVDEMNEEKIKEKKE